MKTKVTWIALKETAKTVLSFHWVIFSAYTNSAKTSWPPAFMIFNVAVYQWLLLLFFPWLSVLSFTSNISDEAVLILHYECYTSTYVIFLGVSNQPFFHSIFFPAFRLWKVSTLITLRKLMLPSHLQVIDFAYSFLWTQCTKTNNSESDRICDNNNIFIAGERGFSPLLWLPTHIFGFLSKYSMQLLLQAIMTTTV